MDAVQAGDVDGVRAFCETATTDPPMYVEQYIKEQWWKQVRSRLHIDMRSEYDLLDSMARMKKERLAELGWVKELDDLERTFVRILEILKDRYLLSVHSPLFVINFLACNHYGLANAYVDLFQPETCVDIHLALVLLDRSLHQEHFPTRYNKDKSHEVVDTFVAHCHRSLPYCTVQDVVHGREFTPLLQKCIDIWFRNPNLFKHRQAFIEVTEDIEAHAKGKPLSRDLIADYLTNTHMNKDIHQYIGDYSPHSKKRRSPHSQEHSSKKQKTTPGGKRKTMARRRKGMRGYTRKPNQ